MGLIIDLFSGGGGASEGIRIALGRDPDVAVNHDPIAVAMHARNHPGTKHFCQDVFSVPPQWATKGQAVDLLWGSPDCTHFSKAKGGAPTRDLKRRDLAWVIVKWAREVRPAVICLENVEEFTTWGPLDSTGKIIDSAKGDTFRSFVASLPRHADAPKGEQSVADLMAELKRRQLVNSTCDQNERELKEVEDRIAKGADYIASLETQLAEITKKIADAKGTLSGLRDDADKCRQVVSQLSREDEQEIVAKMGDLQNLNAKHAANVKHDEAVKKVERLQADSETLTNEIEGIDNEKSKLIQSAKFPVPGMGFDENGVLLNGLPFSQASDAEKIRASVAMGLAMNPKLKVVLIRDGSLLDEASLALAAEMAAEHDAQVWIERVGKGNECSVIIEDGQVQTA